MFNRYLKRKKAGAAAIATVPAILGYRKSHAGPTPRAFLLQQHLNPKEYEKQQHLAQKPCHNSIHNAQQMAMIKCPAQHGRESDKANEWHNCHETTSLCNAERQNADKRQQASDNVADCHECVMQCKSSFQVHGL